MKEKRKTQILKDIGREVNKGIETSMATQQQTQMPRMKNSGMLSFNESPMKDDNDEMSRSALAAFRIKEEEIERKKMEVKEKVQTHLGRIEEASKRLADILEVSFRKCSLYIRIHACTFGLHIMFKNA